MWSRVVGMAASVAAVTGCVVVIAAVAHNASGAVADGPSDSAAPTSIPATISGGPVIDLPPASAAASVSTTASSPAPSPTASSADHPPAATGTTPTRPPGSTPAAPRPSAAAAPTHAPAPPAAPTSSVAVVRAPGAPTGSALPLGYSTGSASRVITVVAASTASTTATLQAWTKAAGGGWTRVGPAITAHVGSAGLTTHPSESLSATPIGSFTLTQAFGYDANPGTGLPYRRTDGSDWWISQSGPLYNTFQSCSSGCSFAQGDPNEHLYYERPYYAYAVVIDYNTANAPGGVHQGAGSAFFLHVTDGAPTAGCVAIPQNNLIPLMQWLVPSSHPRILIGVS